MGRTPDAYDGPRIDEAVIWEEQPSDPTEALKTQYVQGKGLVILEDGVVRGVGEARANILQPPVDDRDVDTPPVTPSLGHRVIVGGTPTGVFVGHAGEIAQWDGSAWVFTTPKHGTLTYVSDEDEPYKQVNDSFPWSWVILSAGGSLPPATQVGEVLYTVNGTTFSVQHPLTGLAGWLVNDEGLLLVVG
jgi:hypothetical protein